MIGMLAVLGSAEYLTRLARETPEQAPPPIEVQLAALPMTSDAPLVGVMQLPSSGAPVQIRLVPYR